MTFPRPPLSTHAHISPYSDTIITDLYSYYYISLQDILNKYHLAQLPTCFIY